MENAHRTSLQPENNELRRSDAENNAKRILAAAIDVLGDNPFADIQSIANKAEVGRATVYRHFPCREVLVSAIHDLLFDELEQAIAAAQLSEGSAEAAFRRLVPAILAIGVRYRIILSGQPKQHRFSGDTRKDSLAESLTDLFRRGQRNAEFSRAVPPDWMTVFLRSLVGLAVTDIVAEKTSIDKAQRTVVSAVLDGVLRRDSK